jgi:hypothetical protein
MDSIGSREEGTAVGARLLSRLSAGSQDPDVGALTFDEVLWVRDRALGGRLVAPRIVLVLVEAYFEARGSRLPKPD